MFFFPDFLSKIFFIRQPEIIYDRMICSFTISLSYPRTHPLSSLSPSLYICSWFSNKPPQEIINNPISLLLPYVRYLHFCLEKCLFLKHFQNNFKIF